jgi:hypothetical protein
MRGWRTFLRSTTLNTRSSRIFLSFPSRRVYKTGSPTRVVLNTMGIYTSHGLQRCPERLSYPDVAGS